MNCERCPYKIIHDKQFQKLMKEADKLIEDNRRFREEQND